MRVGMIGTGAISHKHAEAYRNIGYELTVCTDINAEAGRRFASQHGAEFVESYEAVCRHPRVDYVDVCTFPGFPHAGRSRSAREPGKHIQVQKPIATNLENRAPDGGHGAAGRHPAGRGEPAPFRRFQPVPAAGHRRGTAGQAAAVRLLREVVPVAGILCAAHQGQLADRGRRRADQPGDSPGGYPALAGGAGARGVRRLAAWARCTRSNRRTW